MRKKDLSEAVSVFGTGILCCLFAVFHPKFAIALTLSGIERGRYDNNGQDLSYELAGGLNYAAGNSHGLEFRNFFVFNIPSQSDRVTAATLRPQNLTSTFPEGIDVTTYQLYDVSTEIDYLMDRTAGVEAFDDLGTGTMFGAIDISRDDEGEFVDIPLNSDGLAALNTGHGEWAVGGRLLTSLPRDETHIVFGHTQEAPPVELILSFDPVMHAGDANQDLAFNQLDLVQVFQAGKYLTSQPATWGEGDWDGAPGGTPGNPPSGDGVFDQQDIVTALRAGFYLTGPYGAAGSLSGTRYLQHVAATQVPIPEPTALVLLLIGSVLVVASYPILFSRKTKLLHHSK